MFGPPQEARPRPRRGGSFLPTRIFGKRFRCRAGAIRSSNAAPACAIKRRARRFPVGGIPTRWRSWRSSGFGRVRWPRKKNRDGGRNKDRPSIPAVVNPSGSGRSTRRATSVSTADKARAHKERMRGGGRRRSEFPATRGAPIRSGRVGAAMGWNGSIVPFPAARPTQGRGNRGGYTPALGRSPVRPSRAVAGGRPAAAAPSP